MLLALISSAMALRVVVPAAKDCVEGCGDAGFGKLYPRAGGLLLLVFIL